jgi:transcription elongation GreA/GreB family factor
MATAPATNNAPFAVIERPRVSVNTTDLVTRASAIERIESAEQLEIAAEIKKNLTSLKKKIESDFAPTKDAINAAKNALMAQIHGYLDPIDNAIARLQTLGNTYLREEERKRIEEQRRKQEEERKRLEAERLEEAAMLEAMGENETAEQLISEPVEVAPIPTMAPPPPVAGVAQVRTWTYEITDRKALYHAIAAAPEGHVLREVDTILAKVLGGVARKHKDSLPIPGVHFKSELSARSK